MNEDQPQASIGAGGGTGEWSPSVVIIGSNGSADRRVVNVGTSENPNYFGSAEAIGRLHGIQEALAAVKNCTPKAGYEYDDCVAAIEALLPKD